MSLCSPRYPPTVYRPNKIVDVIELFKFTSLRIVHVMFMSLCQSHVSNEVAVVFDFLRHFFS